MQIFKQQIYSINRCIIDLQQISNQPKNPKYRKKHKQQRQHKTTIKNNKLTAASQINPPGSIKYHHYHYHYHYHQHYYCSMQLSKYLDPFSIPTQLNNLCMLIIAVITHQTNMETTCLDSRLNSYLLFILYGSCLVVTGTFILWVLYMLGVIDYCINKICPFGEVCLTLNTVGIFAIGIVYHCVATVYSIWVWLWYPKSQCIELQMFKRITGIVYAVWVIGIVLILLFSFWRTRLRSRYAQLNQRFVRA